MAAILFPASDLSKCIRVYFFLPQYEITRRKHDVCTTLSENINGDNEAYKTTHDNAANWTEVKNRADWEKAIKETKVCIGL
jgi:inorganic pyrophosphatase